MSNVLVRCPSRARAGRAQPLSPWMANGRKLTNHPPRNINKYFEICYLLIALAYVTDGCNCFGKGESTTVGGDADTLADSTAPGSASFLPETFPPATEGDGVSSTGCANRPTTPSTLPSAKTLASACEFLPETSEGAKEKRKVAVTARAEEYDSRHGEKRSPSCFLCRIPGFRQDVASWREPFQ